MRVDPFGGFVNVNDWLSHNCARCERYERYDGPGDSKSHHDWLEARCKACHECGELLSDYPQRGSVSEETARRIGVNPLAHYPWPCPGFCKRKGVRKSTVDRAQEEKDGGKKSRTNRR